MSDIVKTSSIIHKSIQEYTEEELIILDQFNKEIEAKNLIFTIGDHVINRDGNIIKITKFEVEQYECWYQDRKLLVEPIILERKIVHYQDYRGSKGESRFELKDMIYYGYSTKIFGTIEELHSDVIKIITGEKELVDKYDTTISDSTDVLGSISKDLLLSQQKQLTIKMNMMQAKSAYLKKFLENKRSEMSAIVDGFTQQIKKIMKIIQTLELFLGINEDLFQIQEGPTASVNEPVTFRQQLLFMDEEVGDPEDQGIDFRNIEDFDQWLLKYNTFYKKKNYDLLLPEKKGIIAIRIRRSDKQYEDNYFINRLLNIPNKAVYLLIRNGDNIYRIFSENLQINNRLFPKRTEIMELSEEMLKHNTSYRRNNLDDTITDYKSSFVMLQGLLDRTTVFYPIPEPINLLSDEALNKNLVRFIYDDEICLPTGRLTYREWMKNINSSIEEGCRIFMKSYGFKNDLYYINERLKKYYSNSYSAPVGPNSGLYTVIKDAEWNNNLKIIFKGTKNVWDDEESKKGFSFKLKSSDDFFLNFDSTTLDEIEFYMFNRLDRKHYLDMIPLLVQMKDFKLKENELDSNFNKLVISELLNTKIISSNEIPQVEKEIDELIIWWKLKNKWKRAIEADNQKALRMIVKQFKSNHK